MNNLKNEMDEYVLKANKREERKLNKQKREAIRECRRVLHLLGKKRAFKKEGEFIEKKMIPYIGRMKWMPWSFKNMLEMWSEYSDKSKN